jgi:hypothetical protein
VQEEERLTHVEETVIVRGCQVFISGDLTIISTPVTVSVAGGHTNTWEVTVCLRV